MSARLVRLVWVLTATVLAGLAAVDARALDTTRSVTQLHHTAWTLRDGMPAYINELAQTPDGTLWISAASGLYRFDGIHLEPFEQELPGITAFALAVSSSGDLWIGTTLGVSRLKDGHLTNFVLPDMGRPLGIKFIAIGRNDEVWIANDKVARFDGRNWQVMDSDWGSSGQYREPGGVWALAAARDGVVWTKNLLGLYYLRPGSTRFIKADNYAGGMIDFARDAEGRLWTADFATKRFYALPDLGPSGAPPPPARIGAAVPEHVLGRVAFDRDGALWCSNSITGGLFRVRSVTASQAEAEEFSPMDGLTAGRPGRVVEDREGDLWVGTYEGINRFSPADIQTVPTISIRDFGARITASHDAVYVADGWPPPAPATGHNKQHFYAITDGEPRPLAIDIGDSMVLNGQGTDPTLIASREKLVSLRDGVFTNIPFPKDANGAALVSASQHQDDLWVAFEGRGVFRRRNDQWTHVAALGITDIYSNLRTDQQGAVWLMQGQEMKRFDADRLQQYSQATGPGIGAILSFNSDSRGVLLGGIRGVSFFDGREFHTISLRQAPFLAMVVGVVSDDVGGTWFHTASGICRVSSARLQQAFRDPAVHLDYQLYDARDGLRSIGAFRQWGGSAARGPDGRLWFLNSDNVAWIDPRHLHLNAVPPNVSIRSLTVDEHVMDPSLKTLAAGVSNLQIDYTAISLRSPDRVKFRYQMEGVDKTWVDAGSRRQAFYSRLEPGKYRFHVIAANNDGVWNKTGASIQFEIPPTFLQSGWFLLLCVLLAAPVLWLLYSLRMRQVTAALRSRYEERVAERERIARELHDTLLQAVQGLILKFQAVSEEIPRDSTSRRAMEQALGRAEGVLVEGRDRVKDLRVSPAATPDLAAAIGAMAADVANEKSHRFDLSVEGTPRALDSIAGEEVMRIAQEALTNAFRHARATRIETEIIYDHSELRLRIRDNGCGIDDIILEQGRPDHWGLAGMRERAKKLHGQLEVWSRKGAGTEVELRVPSRIAFRRHRRWRWWSPDSLLTEQ